MFTSQCNCHIKKFAFVEINYSNKLHKGEYLKFYSPNFNVKVLT